MLQQPPILEILLNSDDYSLQKEGKVKPQDHDSGDTLTNHVTNSKVMSP
jgi:hypothetical protein